MDEQAVVVEHDLRPTPVPKDVDCAWVRDQEAREWLRCRANELNRKEK